MNVTLVAALGLLSGDPHAPASIAPKGTVWVGPAAFRGAIELVPALATPRHTDRRDLTRVFARFPGPGSVALADVRDRRSITVAAGSVLDRVEYRKFAGAWGAVDVRGTQVLSGGGERFHAYRRAGIRAPDLFGVAWLRGDRSDEERAVDAMRDALRSGVGIVPDGKLRGRTVDRYVGMLRCSSCHAHDAPVRWGGASAGPRRPTDHSGFYSLIATLSDESVLETYRPLDPNCGRVGVTRRGAPGHPTTVESGDECRADGQVTGAVLDVARGLAARDPATLALCASRRALTPYLSADVQRAYAKELSECTK
jgi:hypothetical protein